MAWTQEDQTRLNSERFKTGVVKRIVVDLLASDYEQWQLYASANQMQRATMIRNCVRRCMLEDGYITADEVTLAESSKQLDEANNSEPITKRPPGRPRKHPAESDTIDKPKRGRGRPRKVYSIESNQDGQ